MVDGRDLRDILRDVSGAVVLGIDGESLDSLDFGVPDSPTLLVAPIADALKTVSEDGFVTGSVDREDMWGVVGYHLDEETSHRLAEENVEISEIHRAVVDMGLIWRASPIDDLA